MRVDGVVFASPDGLEDSTNYIFRSDASSEEVTVELELPVGRGTPAEDVIAEMRESLAGFYAGKFRVVAEGDATLAGEPAKFLHYRLGGEVVGKYVVANIGPLGADDRPAASERDAAGQGPPDPPEKLRDWVKVGWTGERDTEALDAHVDAMFASFGPAHAPAPAVPRGVERHEAGPWAFWLPPGFLGPRTFIFEDVDAELRIELSILHADADEPELEPGAAVAGGEETRRDERELDGGERLDLSVRSDDDPHGESALILVKRKIDLAGDRAGEHRWVVLSASAPAGEGPRLIAIVDDLVASIAAQEGTA